MAPERGYREVVTKSSRSGASERSTEAPRRTRRRTQPKRARSQERKPHTRRRAERRPAEPLLGRTRGSAVAAVAGFRYALNRMIQYGACRDNDSDEGHRVSLPLSSRCFRTAASWAAPAFRNDARRSVVSQAPPVQNFPRTRLVIELINR